MKKREKAQYLMYDFKYDEIRHRASTKLEDGLNGIEMQYDDHNLEIIWLKRIRHKGKYMVINIAIKDDWYDMEALGMVTASPWICVYDKSRRFIVDEFEPDEWSYVDGVKSSNSTTKKAYYK